jgi:oligopeptidase A
MGQNQALFNAYQAIANSAEFSTLDPAQQRVIDNGLTDFRLSGIHLDQAKQQRYKEISQQLSELCSHYSDNVLDATNGWNQHISDKNELKGLPESALAQAKQAAEQAGKKGWHINLHIPSYIAVMTYADNRALRQQHYQAFVTRASELGNQPDWDNSKIMETILSLRHEKAQLLGFSHYAELSLAKKMAKNSEAVTRFLNQLAEKSLPKAHQDLAQLVQFAKEEQ